ncbi:site-specific integrase [Paenibacillus sp. SAF-054]|uniref:site-specific integrase n=1 Tax=unclassified Paenibacillus TaxID=185978 RepID=UPI003F7E0DC9
MDAVGVPVVPVMKYLKYLDQTGKSNNTLKNYCYALKQYFTYPEERKINYKEEGVKDLADFVGWLRKINTLFCSITVIHFQFRASVQLAYSLMLSSRSSIRSGGILRARDCSSVARTESG